MKKGPTILQAILCENLDTASLFPYAYYILYIIVYVYYGDNHKK